MSAAKIGAAWAVAARLTVTFDRPVSIPLMGRPRLVARGDPIPRGESVEFRRDASGAILGRLGGTEIRVR